VAASPATLCISSTSTVSCDLMNRRTVCAKERAQMLTLHMDGWSSHKIGRRHIPFSPTQHFLHSLFFAWKYRLIDAPGVGRLGFPLICGSHSVSTIRGGPWCDLDPYRGGLWCDLDPYRHTNGPPKIPVPHTRRPSHFHLRAVYEG